MHDAGREVNNSSGFSKQTIILHVVKFKQRDGPTVVSNDREIFDEKEKKNKIYKRISFGDKCYSIQEK